LLASTTRLPEAKPASPRNRPRLKYRQHAERHAPDAPDNIPGFCNDVGISVSLFYTLRRQGLGPAETKLGSKRIVITQEAKKAWLAKREAASRAAAAERAGTGATAESNAANSRAAESTAEPGKPRTRSSFESDTAAESDAASDAVT
jgi:hypothetical protein